jgi:hypothetical protein
VEMIAQIAKDRANDAKTKENLNVSLIVNDGWLAD